jgi:hypothetical protein
MKIAILDDYQNVASSLADWDSLAAEVVVFTKAPQLTIFALIPLRSLPDGNCRSHHEA